MATTQLTDLEIESIPLPPSLEQEINKVIEKEEELPPPILDEEIEEESLPIALPSLAEATEKVDLKKKEIKRPKPFYAVPKPTLFNTNWEDFEDKLRNHPTERGKEKFLPKEKKKTKFSKKVEKGEIVPTLPPILPPPTGTETYFSTVFDENPKDLIAYQAIEMVGNYMHLQSGKTFTLSQIMNNKISREEVERVEITQEEPDEFFYKREPIKKETLIRDLQQIKAKLLGQYSFKFPPLGKINKDEFEKYFPKELIAKTHPRQINWNDKESYYFPKYFPQPQQVFMSWEFISVFRKTLLWMGENRDPMYQFGVDMWEEMVYVANNFYCGNGTYKGQLGRLEACININKEVKSWPNKLTDDASKLDRFLPVLRAFWPVPVKPKPIEYTNFFKKASWEELHTWYKQWGVNLEAFPQMTKNLILNPGLAQGENSPITFAEYVDALSFNPKASAGVVWNQTAKINLIPQLLLDSVHVFHSFWKAETPKKFWSENKWKYLDVVGLKPKVEVYKRSDLDHKTRNYLLYNAEGILPMQAIMTLGLRNMHLFGENNSKSLLGYNFFYGGMDRFIKSFREGGGIAVMSDNVFIKTVDKDNGQLMFTSVDAEKAESCATYNDCLLLAKYIISLFEDLDPSWNHYLLNFVPKVAIDPIFLINSIQGVTPGSGSGHPGTAYLNQIKTILWANEFLAREERDPRGIPYIDNKGSFSRLVEINKVSGVKMKITQSVYWPELESQQDYYEIDLLGFGAVNGRVLGLDGMWLPVLEKERFFKAMLFFKNDPTENKNISFREREVIKFWRLRALYLIGGWFYRPLDKVIGTLCYEKQKFLSEKETNLSDDLIKESIGAAFSNVGIHETPKGLVEASISHELPSLAEVAFFLSGKKNDDQGYRVPILLAKQEYSFQIKKTPPKVNRTSFGKNIYKPEPVKLGQGDLPKPYGAKERWKKMSKEEQQKHRDKVDILTHRLGGKLKFNSYLNKLASIMKISIIPLAESTSLSGPLTRKSNEEIEEIARAIV